MHTVFNISKYTIMLVISFLSLILILISCNKTTEPLGIKNGPDTTSHNYTWTFDSLEAPPEEDVWQINMRDIWGTDENNVWIVGHSDYTAYQIWHWDGQKWSPFKPQIYGNRPSYKDIIGFSAGDIWIVGDGTYRSRTDPQHYIRDYILHYDGSQWKRIDEIWAPFCQSIWGTSSDNLFIGCDSGIVLHKNENSWQKQTTNTNTQILSIWGFDNDSVFAIGSANETQMYFFFKYENGQWIIKDQFYGAIPPNERKFGYKIWGLDLDHFYSVGGWHLFRYKNNKWEIEMPVPTSLFTVYGDRENNIFCGGYKGQLYHFNGSSWYKYIDLLDPEMEVLDIWCNSTHVFALINAGYKTHILRGKLNKQKGR